jgi:hypothetical protein
LAHFKVKKLRIRRTYQRDQEINSEAKEELRKYDVLETKGKESMMPKDEN